MSLCMKRLCLVWASYLCSQVSPVIFIDHRMLCGSLFEVYNGIRKLPLKTFLFFSIAGQNLQPPMSTPCQISGVCNHFTESEHEG